MSYSVVAISPYKPLLIYILYLLQQMNNTKTNFLQAVRATETYETLERLPLSNQIENGFITVSDKWIVRFHTIFDNTDNEIKNSLKRQQAEVEAELEETKDELYKEELESLNTQLCNMVRKADKQESLNEYGIQLNSVEELNQMVSEIVRANKKTIWWIIYLLGWALEIDGNTIQKTHSDYNRIRLYTKEKRDNPKDWIIKNIKDGTTVKLKDYIENPDYKPEDYEVIREKELEEVSVKDYLKKKAGL